MPKKVRMTGKQAEEYARNAHRKETFRKAKKGDSEAVQQVTQNGEQPRSRRVQRGQSSTQRARSRWPF